MELTEKDKQIIIDLCNIAWQAGALRSPQMAMEVEALRQKMVPKPVLMPVPDKPKPLKEVK